jgi:thymidylate kinase
MPIVAIDGREGVGRTATAKLLVQRLGGKLVTKDLLPDDYRKTQIRVEREGRTDRRFEFYRSLDKLYMRRARAVSNEGRYAFLDTSAFGTLAVHRVLGSREAINLDVPRALTPDLTVILDCDEEIVRERLGRPHRLARRTHWVDTLLERDAMLRAEFASFELPTIDSGQDISVVADQVLSLVRRI